MGGLLFFWRVVVHSPLAGSLVTPLQLARQTDEQALNSENLTFECLQANNRSGSTFSSLR